MACASESATPIDALQTAGSALLDSEWNVALRDMRPSDAEVQAIEAMADNFGLRASSPPAATNAWTASGACGSWSTADTPRSRATSPSTKTKPAITPSRRIIFDGKRGNRTYPWETLLGVTPYSDGLQLERTDGASPILRLDDPEYATVLITSRLAR